MDSPSTKNITLFRGVTRIDVHENGVRTGYQDIGEADKLTILTPDIQELEQFTSRDRTGGKVKGKITRVTPKLEISGQEMSVFNMALQLLGLRDVVTQVGATVTDFALASAVKLGRSYRVGKRNLSSVTNVKQGATTLTVDEDYELDLKRGLIYFPLTSGATEGVAATTTFIYESATFHRVKIAKDLQKEVSIYFAGADREEGEGEEATYDLEVFRALIKPSANMELINPPGASEFSRWTITADVLSDAIGDFGGTPDNPYSELIEIPVES